MQTTSISQVIESFDILSLEDKEYAFKLFEKNISESKRDLLIKRVNESKQNYLAGNVKQGTISDLLEDLEND